MAPPPMMRMWTWRSARKAHVRLSPGHSRDRRAAPAERSPVTLLLGDDQLVAAGADIILGHAIGFADIAVADGLADRVADSRRWSDSRPARRRAGSVSRPSSTIEGSIGGEAGEPFLEQG